MIKTPKGLSKAGETMNHTTSSSPLARKALAAKQRQKREDVTAAMEVSQRKGAMESSPKIFAALIRTVEAAKLTLKKQMITGAMEKTQRSAAIQRNPPASKALERTVTANDGVYA